MRVGLPVGGGGRSVKRRRNDDLGSRNRLYLLRPFPARHEALQAGSQSIVFLFGKHGIERGVAVRLDLVGPQTVIEPVAVIRPIQPAAMRAQREGRGGLRFLGSVDGLASFGEPTQDGIGQEVGQHDAALGIKGREDTAIGEVAEEFALESQVEQAGMAEDRDRLQTAPAIFLSATLGGIGDDEVGVQQWVAMSGPQMGEARAHQSVRGELNPALVVALREAFDQREGVEGCGVPSLADSFRGRGIAGAECRDGEGFVGGENHVPTGSPLAEEATRARIVALENRVEGILRHPRIRFKADGLGSLADPEAALLCRLQAGVLEEVAHPLGGVGEGAEGKHERRAKKYD